MNSLPLDSLLIRWSIIYSRAFSVRSMMYGQSLPQLIQQQVLHCHPHASKSRVGSLKRGIGFLRSFAQRLGLPVAKRQRKSWKVTRKLPLFHTLMNSFVNCYAVGGGKIISSPFRMKHMLVLIQFFLKIMMIVTTDIYSVYKSIRY